MGSAENTITIDEDEGFSEAMTPPATTTSTTSSSSAFYREKTSTPLPLDSSLIKYFSK